ncbi:MAG: STAS domain-containing protein [Planctomycetota bacterium]|nr:STAS domain-containing protein [Planctomycetota bacterium]
MSSSLNIHQRNDGSVVILHLSGTLDGHTFVEMERAMKELVAAGNKIFVVELSELTYIASAGVGVFINVQQTVSEHGGGLLLVDPSPVVKEVFDILGLQALFQIHSSTEHALAAAERLDG